VPHTVADILKATVSLEKMMSKFYKKVRGSTRSPGTAAQVLVGWN